MILAIDPGTIESGYVIWDGRVIAAGCEANESILARIQSGAFDTVAIERFESRGMPLGMDSIHTVEWVGRFWQAALQVKSDAGPSVWLVFRREIKAHWCGTTAAKDPNVRAAIIDVFGGERVAKGTKSAPGPLYGVSGHAWAALAVALIVAGVGSEVKA